MILADEVGLGKTIEAGIILLQKWSESKKRILIILPPNLINQWCEELNNKFFLPTFVIDSHKFRMLKNEGRENPLLRDEILVCTYNFAYDKHEYFEDVNWDVVVFDEAHKLLNVYKEEHLLICSMSYEKECRDQFSNITIQQIPRVLIGKCDFMKESYSLNLSQDNEAEKEDLTDE